ncbi:MAG: 3-oxoadipate enol-lactonase [Ectothiorhodospiraceae bacterium]|nr:3-oxoadipate enol-lactonase [Ectothiorhodospiraceae bacterium]
MRAIRVNDIVVNYALEGPADAPVILFANSLGTDLRVWDAVAEDLQRDYRVLRYDKRGHGLTEASAGDYSMEGLVADALGLLDALDLDRVHVCGLSIGGMIGQQLAATHPQRVDRLVLCDTTMRMPDAAPWDERIRAVRNQGLEEIAAGAMERWFTPALRGSETEALFRSMVARTTVDGYAGCCAAIRDMDLVALVPSIQAPTLVLVGEDDPGTPPAMARELASALRDSRLVLIPRAAHLPCVEQPAAVIRALRDFLSQ